MLISPLSILLVVAGTFAFGISQNKASLFDEAEFVQRFWNVTRDPFFQGSRYVADSCPKRWQGKNAGVHGGFADVATKANVRCCNSNGCKLATLDLLTYAEADELCNKFNKQLCDAGEVGDGRCCGQNTAQDRRIWTTSAPGDTYVEAACKPNTFKEGLFRRSDKFATTCCDVKEDGDVDCAATEQGMKTLRNYSEAKKFCADANKELCSLAALKSNRCCSSLDSLSAHSQYMPVWTSLHGGAHYETFLRTGCPNKDVELGHWYEEQPEDFLDGILNICQKNQVGEATQEQSDFCCGVGRICQPTSCSRQKAIEKHSTWSAAEELNFVNCIEDPQGDLLPYGKSFLSDEMTPMTCMEYCGERGYFLGGVRGSKCRCSNELYLTVIEMKCVKQKNPFVKIGKVCLPKKTKRVRKSVAGSACNMPCSGDSAKGCGGQGLVSVFRTTPFYLGKFKIPESLTLHENDLVCNGAKSCIASCRDKCLQEKFEVAFINTTGKQCYCYHTISPEDGFKQKQPVSKGKRVFQAFPTGFISTPEYKFFDSSRSLVTLVEDIYGYLKDGKIKITLKTVVSFFKKFKTKNEIIKFMRNFVKEVTQMALIVKNAIPVILDYTFGLLGDLMQPLIDMNNAVRTLASEPGYAINDPRQEEYCQSIFQQFLAEVPCIVNPGGDDGHGCEPWKDGDGCTTAMISAFEQTIQYIPHPVGWALMGNMPNTQCTGYMAMKCAVISKGGDEKWFSE